MVVVVVVVVVVVDASTVVVVGPLVGGVVGNGRVGSGGEVGLGAPLNRDVVVIRGVPPLAASTRLRWPTVG